MHTTCTIFTLDINVFKKKTFKECINFELLNNQLALGKGNFKLEMMSSIKSMTEKNKSMTYFYEKQTRLGNNINRIPKSSTNEGHVNVVTS